MRPGSDVFQRFRSITREKRLIDIQMTATSPVTPLLLDLIRMAVHGRIPVGRIAGELEAAFIADLLTVRIEPGIQPWISHRFRKLMGGDIDGAIGIDVVVRCLRNATTIEAGPGIGEIRVDGVAATKGAMIPAVGREGTLRPRGIKALVLVLGCEDKEQVVN